VGRRLGRSICYWKLLVSGACPTAPGRQARSDNERNSTSQLSGICNAPLNIIEFVIQYIPQDDPCL
ncbi:MAG: hypothetical protein CVT94_16960, partial [Bacteroidetes bacterium HGW-Bacteroidetes-11]